MESIHMFLSIFMFALFGISCLLKDTKNNKFILYGFFIHYTGMVLYAQYGLFGYILNLLLWFALMAGCIKLIELTNRNLQLFKVETE